MITKVRLQEARQNLNIYEVPHMKDRTAHTIINLVIIDSGKQRSVAL